MMATAPAHIATFFEYGVAKTLRKLYARAASRVARGRRGRENCGGSDVVTSRYGVKMRANWGDRTFQYCRYAIYGHILSDFLAGQKAPFSFLDIGANQGLYSLLAARNPYCVEAVAFEPVTTTFALLRDNIALNQSEDRIRPVHAAVSLHSGMATIATDARHSGTASLRHAGSGSTAGEAAREEIHILGITAVDTLIAGTTPLIVKIDVEGHEETVIEALLASEHSARIAAIFYEVDHRWTHDAATRARLKTAGFTRFAQYGFGRHYDILAERPMPHARE